MVFKAGEGVFVADVLVLRDVIGDKESRTVDMLGELDFAQID